jgi:hypothetical protein
MAHTDSLRQEAENLTAEATHLLEQDARQEALAALRRAMLLYAEVDRQTQAEDQPSPLRRYVRAETCERYADGLTTAEEYAEAANIYQEASDLYGGSGGDEGEQGARRCAHKALESVAALRARPQDRLYLLIAHYDRQQRQLALQADTEERQGDCCVHIAGIFQRRDRPRESVARYQEALTLYGRAPQTPAVLLAIAACHHRVAGLMANALDDLPGAVQHYRAAITLYAAHETAVYGVQQEHALCVRALTDVERLLESRPRETSID